MAFREMEECFAALFIIKGMELVIACFLITSTLLLILTHHRFRKQHHIFPFNLALADLMGVIVYTVFEIKRYNNQDLIFAIELKILAGTLYMSFIVSATSILLVAIYQFITIRIDPFGVKNIITTTRCIIVCVVTWVIAGGLMMFTDKFTGHYPIINSGFIVISLLATCICYIFIYRSVAKVESNGNNLLEERKKENQRVLRTFCIILGTTVFVMLYPLAFAAFNSLETSCFKISVCFVYLQDMLVITNFIANSLIYWWRLKDFRSVVMTCAKGCNTRSTHVIEI